MTNLITFFQEYHDFILYVLPTMAILTIIISCFLLMKKKQELIEETKSFYIFCQEKEARLEEEIRELEGFLTESGKPGLAWAREFPEKAERYFRKINELREIQSLIGDCEKIIG